MGGVSGGWGGVEEGVAGCAGCRQGGGRAHRPTSTLRLHLPTHLPTPHTCPGTYGAPPVDFLPYQDPSAYEQLLRAAEGFIERRALVHIGEVAPPPVVHVVKVGGLIGGRVGWVNWWGLGGRWVWVGERGCELAG